MVDGLSARQRVERAGTVRRELHAEALRRSRAVGVVAAAEARSRRVHHVDAAGARKAVREQRVAHRGDRQHAVRAGDERREAHRVQGAPGPARGARGVGERAEVRERVGEGAQEHRVARLRGGRAEVVPEHALAGGVAGGEIGGALEEVQHNAHAVHGHAAEGAQLVAEGAADHSREPPVKDRRRDGVGALRVGDRGAHARRSVEGPRRDAHRGVAQRRLLGLQRDGERAQVGVRSRRRPLRLEPREGPREERTKAPAGEHRVVRLHGDHVLHGGLVVQVREALRDALGAPPRGVVAAQVRGGVEGVAIEGRAELVVVRRDDERPLRAALGVRELRVGHGAGPLGVAGAREHRARVRSA